MQQQEATKKTAEREGTMTLFVRGKQPRLEELLSKAGHRQLTSTSEHHKREKIGTSYTDAALQPRDREGAGTYVAVLRTTLVGEMENRART